MKNRYLISIIFVIMMLMTFGLQTLWIGNFPSGKFNDQVGRQLISAVQIKGEFVNDYFLEGKRDVGFLASFDVVEDVFNGEVGYNDIIRTNLGKRIERTSGQVDIFREKYPRMSDFDLASNEELKNIVNFDFGVKSKIFLDDNGQVDYVLDEKDFRVAEKNRVLDKFLELNGYSDLLLIERDGFVIYGNGIETGINVEYLGGDLKHIYQESIGGRDLIYGPYIRETFEGFEESLAFVSKTDEGDVIVLIDSMDFLNGNLIEGVGFSGKEYVYLVNKENFIVSSLREKESRGFAQKVSNDNIQKCFSGKSNVSLEDILDFSYGALGDNSISNYAYVEETDWCLISEISEKNILELNKRHFPSGKFLALGLFDLVLFFVGIYFMRRFEL